MNFKNTNKIQISLILLISLISCKSIDLITSKNEKVFEDNTKIQINKVVELFSIIDLKN